MPSTSGVSTTRGHSRARSSVAHLKEIPMDSSPNTHSSSTAALSLAHFLSPRKSGTRLKFAHGIALLGLVSLSAWVFFFAHPALSFSPIAITNERMGGQSDAARDYLQKTASRRKKTAGSVVKAQVALDPSSELAAITSFLASLPQNSIPLSVDPTKPIDPQLVLDFDTRSGARADQNVVELINDTWESYPVVMYGKLYSPISREVKSILANMHLRPAPTIIDVDMRDDAEVLKPVLARLTSSDLPIVLIGGKLIGSISEIRALDASGDLRRMVRDAGAIIDGAKRRKGKK